MAKRGKKPKFKAPGTFRRAMNKYFELREAEGKPLTIPGLCLHLGISKDYFIKIINGKRSEHLRAVAKEAKLTCEAYTVERLHTKGANPAGAIFLLKTSFNHKEREEEDLKLGGITIRFANPPKSIDYAKAEKITEVPDSDITDTTPKTGRDTKEPSKV